MTSFIRGRFTRETLVAVVLAAAVYPTAALADADADCRSQVPSRVVPGCTERLKAPNLTVPQRVLALQFRSWAHTEVKAFEAAEADVNEIFKIEPNSPTGYGARGRLRHFLGNNDLALNDYNQSVALAANKYIYLLNRGLFFIRTANFDPARSDYEAAMTLDPKRAAPYLGRAKVHRQKNNDDAALKDLDMAVSLEPELGVSYLDRGDLLLTMREPRRALADFDKALALLKTSTRATRGRETAMGMLNSDGSGGGATKPPQTAAAPATTPPVAPAPPRPASASPSPPQPGAPTAQPAAPKPVQPASAPVTPAAPGAPAAPAAPAATDAQLQQALELRKANKPREAIAIYEKILAAEPENARALLGRAATYEDNDEHRGAFQGYQALRKSKAPPEFKLAATEGLMRVLAKVGEYAGAIGEAGEALKMNPKSEEAFYWRGFSLVRTHRFGAAIADFRRIEKPTIRTAAWEAYAQAALGDHAAALTNAETVTKANDKHPLPYVTRARVALAKGDLVKAEEENRRASQLGTMPEVTHTAQLILIAKLMKPSDAPLAAKRD